MKTLTRFVPVMVAAFALGGSAVVTRAHADTKSNTSMKSDDKSTCNMDNTTKVKSVMQFLHAANQAEIKLGGLAKTHAQSQDVKTFADQMVKDHTDADKKLSDAAQKQGIDLNAAIQDPVYLGIISMHDEMAKQLSGKNGAAFDVMYMSGQPGDHVLVQKVIEEGQKAATGDNKKLLDEMHATITKHKGHADTIVGKMKLPGAGNVGGGPADQQGTQKKSSTQGSLDQGTSNQTGGVGGGPSSDTKSGASDSSKDMNHNDDYNSPSSKQNAPIK